MHTTERFAAIRGQMECFLASDRASCFTMREGIPDGVVSLSNLYTTLSNLENLPMYVPLGNA